MLVLGFVNPAAAKPAGAIFKMFCPEILAKESHSKLLLDGKNYSAGSAEKRINGRGKGHHLGKFFLILISSALLAGCSGGDSANKKTGLIYWSANNQSEINLATRIVDEWNKLHPNIPVRHQPVPEGESSEEVILAAVVGKTTPDVYSNMWPGDIEFYAHAGKLVPFDQFPDFDSLVTSRYDAEHIERMRSRNGHTYHLLWKTNPILLLYSKDLFAEAGYPTPPGTYSGYLQAGAKICRDINGDGYFDRWLGTTDIRARWRDRLFDFYPLYIAASGGKTFFDKGKLAIDTTAARKVFTFFQEIFRRKYFPKIVPGGGRDLFLARQVASRITGPWEIARLERLKPPDFHYGFSQIPVPDDFRGPVYTYGNPKSIVVFSTTKHPEQAWKFAAFLISRQSDYYLLTMARQLPYRKNLLSDSMFVGFFERNPMMVRFARQAKYTRAEDATTALKEIFDAISQEFEACVIYQAKTPAQAVRDMMARIRLLL